MANTASPYYVVNPLNIDRQEYFGWHVQGRPAFHRDPANELPVDQLQAILEELATPHPFKIGCTGYIELTSSPPKSGKARDELGRNVFIVGPRILFQRYVEGNRYVGKNWLTTLDNGLHDH